MASDINTKNSKPTTQRSSFDQLMDLYWGGTERRITGLTLRIIGINALALLMLMVGVLNFGQYETRIIADKIKTFKTDTHLITKHFVHSRQSLSEITHNLSDISGAIGHEIIVFDKAGAILASTHNPETMIKRMHVPAEPNTVFTVDDIIKDFISLIPNRNPISLFPIRKSGAPDYNAAINANSSIQAWRISNNTNDLLLTSMVHLKFHGEIVTIYIIKSGQDIVRSVHYFWQQLINIFLVILCMTVAISIYLSGTIARPLRKIARTAEAIRRKNNRFISIPDFSKRHDEIGELSLVMRDMTESLWQRVDSIETFAADVAHELKNPLTSLKSAIETMELTKKKSDRDKLLGILKHDINRMDRLITDISKASRLDAELSRDQHQIIDLHNIINQTINRYQSHYGTQYKITLVMPDLDQIHVEGSDHRFNQVLSNILDNAISFSAENDKITISVFQDGHQAIITIDDEGPGISPKKIEHIFDRFYSDRRQKSAFGEHSGLGLSICKQIIDAMGGTIYAENKSNGARFTIKLGLAAAD